MGVISYDADPLLILWQRRIMHRPLSHSATNKDLLRRHLLQRTSAPTKYTRVQWIISNKHCSKIQTQRATTCEEFAGKKGPTWGTRIHRRDGRTSALKGPIVFQRFSRARPEIKLSNEVLEG
ncbi:unnamed protein product [Nesidiocoris tenuis]|uniref:Uncharacterized protein n=1 Tax=Nesidiocoris tenuis TaxID=355587 RepID=A0A6H5GL89_9HEMI|nr:unnamed protein product [Nesidiocoris tenuis]CAB0004152.1 unnamed protein product [Nesidiocoris tenuis]